MSDEYQGRAVQCGGVTDRLPQAWRVQGWV